MRYEWRVSVKRPLKVKRKHWLDHLNRTIDGRSTKKIYNGKLMGKRSAGRPRKKWLKEVQKDLAQNKVTNCKSGIGRSSGV